eukprot:TRINITY_DN19205_c0_g1_i1.p1 TRINITY_DN19205_c0_g1~~TRINITY_DN19205_c0_g1_i1.p1  ORF type:complete len:560 (-),score=104.34 TRINITY_DN19205_c0_g1_i1:325-2004(-)
MHGVRIKSTLGVDDSLDGQPIRSRRNGAGAAFALSAKVSPQIKELERLGCVLPKPSLLLAGRGGSGGARRSISGSPPADASPSPDEGTDHDTRSFGSGRRSSKRFSDEDSDSDLPAPSPPKKQARTGRSRPTRHASSEEESEAAARAPVSAKTAGAVRRLLGTGVKGTGRILWYSGRRQTGVVLADDGSESFITPGGALNKNLVPLTAGGLMHGTHVRFEDTEEYTWQGQPTCKRVIPNDAVTQPGLSVGIERQSGKAGDHNALAAADIVDMGFLVGVMDGHRGGHCATHVARVMPAILHAIYSDRVDKIKGGVESMTAKGERDTLSTCLRDAMKDADHDYLQASMKTVPNWADGASGVMALLAHGFEAPGQTTVAGAPPGGVAKIFLGWLGNCRAILLRGQGVVRMTNDQTPHRKDERERMKANGGKVVNLDGTLKVGRRDKYADKKKGGSYRDMLWLPVSRSFGDLRLKAPHAIVSSEPECAVQTLTPEDWAMVLMCNGITERLSDDEVASVCRDVIMRQRQGPVEASKQVVNAARRKGSQRNVIAVVLRFGWASPA